MRRGESYGSREDGKREEGGVKVIAMTILAIFLFLALLCAMLLLLYFFYYPMGETPAVYHMTVTCPLLPSSVCGDSCVLCGG